MQRIVILFNLGFHYLSKFAFKCSVIQQRHGSSSRLTCSLDFKLIGIQIVTIANGEHRKLIGVETMSSFEYEVRFVLLGYCKVSESKLRAIKKTF